MRCVHLATGETWHHASTQSPPARLSSAPQPQRGVAGGGAGREGEVECGMWNVESGGFVVSALRVESRRLARNSTPAFVH